MQKVSFLTKSSMAASRVTQLTYDALIFSASASCSIVAYVPLSSSCCHRQGPRKRLDHGVVDRRPGALGAARVYTNRRLTGRPG